MKKLLARTQLSEQINQQFPLSPAETGINTTTTLRSSQLLYTATPIAFPEIDDIFSPSPIVPLPKATRGRPSKTQSRPATSFASPESKRQRFLSDYPCPDCGKLFPAERWSEHVKRVHFPDQIWECQKIDAKTGKRCASKPFFRVDNFETHIKKQHRCNEQEVHQLKASWKYVVVDFFHKVCGICGDILNTRENSIEHIREHFKCISQRSQPPIDCGLSEWQEQCHTDHHLRRGIHYQLDNKDRKTLLGNINNPDDEHDSEDEDDDDDRTGGSGGSGSSYGSPRLVGLVGVLQNNPVISNCVTETRKTQLIIVLSNIQALSHVLVEVIIAAISMPVKNLDIPRTTTARHRKTVACTPINQLSKGLVK